MSRTASQYGYARDVSPSLPLMSGRGGLPPLPQPPPRHRGRSHSFIHRRDSQPHVETLDSTGEEYAPPSLLLEHDHHGGFFSRRARSATRSGRATPLLFPSEPLYTCSDVPSARTVPEAPPSTSDSDDPLFAPVSALSARQVRRFQKQAHAGDKKEKSHSMRKLKAELEVAVGVETLVKEQRRSREHGRKGRKGNGVGEEEKDTVLGMFEKLKLGVEEVQSGHSQGGQGGQGGSGSGRGREKTAMEAAGGAAALMGVVGTGLALWQEEKRRRSGRARSEGGVSEGSGAGRGGGRPTSAASHTFGHPARRPSPQSSRARSTISSYPPPSPSPSSNAGQSKIFLSSLTPSQHKTLQHAAAALLIKERGTGSEIERMMMGVLGRVEGVVGLLTKLGHKIEDGNGRSGRLFGTSLSYLTKHEGTDSYHGIDPHTTVHVPEFVDHCITALMQADVTVEGILRRSGNARHIMEIINALDVSGRNDTVIDLAALDPVTLADLFKRFLAALPDPVLTGHLFALFIATSHIKHPGLRKRAMHLVICLMPKVNRDVMEVIFLFLDWLSTYAHINVKDGNQMELTSIAKIMAPTLLRPHKRDPKPVEVPAMITAILNLLEDQHVLHEIPLELAEVLHIDVPPAVNKNSHALVQHFLQVL
ncbi:hypothetical protein JCM5296_000353 [Sporobolomyces johnsonii]